MINLLPPEVKKSYGFARTNVVLRKWLLICLVALIGLAALGTYGLLTLQQSIKSNNDQIASQNAMFKKENYAATQTKVQDMSNNFKLVIKVLGQEVLFSELLKQISSIIPTNANLTNLQITQATGAIDITAEATNYTSASQVQVNLSDPANKIFSKADIVSITCNNATAVNPQYPCVVIVKALFGPNTPFLFVNSKGTT